MTGFETITNLIGNNMTQYLFGNEILAMLFFMAVFIYIMFKLGVSLDAAVPVFIALGFLTAGVLGHSMLWILIFLSAGIIYLALRQLWHK